MRVLVTGQSGFVGRHVVRVLHSRNYEVLDKLEDQPDAIIHLGWGGLPNYESENHFKNIPWQKEFLEESVKRTRNITVAGTCLETVQNPPNYAIAKLAVRALLSEILPEMKWARLWYLYGEGQRDQYLLPRLLKATDEFHVVNGERDFIDVAEVASHICDIATQTKSTGIIDCCSGRS